MAKWVKTEWMVLHGFTIIVRCCFLMFFSGFIVMFDCEQP